MRRIQKSGDRASLIFKDFQAEFLRRAEGDVHFTCEDGEAITELLDRVLATGERDHIPVHVVATVPSISGDEPVALAGFREAIVRDSQGRTERHFVILPFAARWIAGEPQLNEELAEAHWLHPSELQGLRTTEGLADIVAAAFACIEAAA